MKFLCAFINRGADNEIKIDLSAKPKRTSPRNLQKKTFSPPSITYVTPMITSCNATIDLSLEFDEFKEFKEFNEFPHDFHFIPSDC
ncbi:hypothetical protein TVAG_386480 [Trichomonas vaginalis G3]|uniref:Uncharacterized protein n=1 Tax=Trichomonas vaginalis (strain ATCC PRA-98 / G3) TaxID=412133 RepID=A2FSE5_TRIV3|nr:hypothetical protein TVAGG3_0157730 [Trichomonas vaginalis G3]EAX92174.1 hypothetical protein TVAG_386480 [Trichomonas vaginalis G3]KAI5547650.1 hypothetical protein TVAGG3_0157730 [Trichomonas vaginalis G3]|eukprot:XP_001305104.1 hypothetical protein [Trichomonas vaginalis G3]